MTWLFYLVWDNENYYLVRFDLNGMTYGITEPDKERLMNMLGNTTLNNAKYSVDTDEWYTTYETIADELRHYRKQFRGKVVLCNCDDPFESSFTYYFLKNFNILRIKKLICTSYGAYKIDTMKNNVQMVLPIEDEEGNPIVSRNGYILEISCMPGENDSEVDDETIKEMLSRKGTVKKLKGDGDFRSDECIEYLKKCDICCTNPPFSLFSSLFTLLVKYDKKFLLIGNQNAITYKEIFPYIKENKAWVGYHFGDMSFKVPSDTEPRKTRFWIDEYGQKWRSLGNAMWLTNLDIPRRHKELILTQRFDPLVYPVFDDYDAINVSRVANIPMDYDGVMGVPITFLKYYNDSQFEIIGEANHGSDNEFDLFKPRIAGKELFKRILIRKINYEVEEIVV